MKYKIKKFLLWLRFGKIREKVTGTAGDNIPAEIEYYGRNNKMIGFWAYGYFHPDYPYQGE